MHNSPTSSCIRQICDGHHRQLLNKLLCMQRDLEALGASMMAKGLIAVAAAFMFAFSDRTEQQ